MEMIIQYLGQKAKVNCDGCCSKAWGNNSRARRRTGFGEDDWEYLSDEELGTAPKDTGTVEGTHKKPYSPSEFPNKWCVRECERCNMSQPGRWEEDLELKTFTKDAELHKDSR